MLKDELESNLIINHLEFFNAFFSGIPQLSKIAIAILERYKELKAPDYKEGVG